jgi:phosphotransferase system HPr (HPr) family protein
VADALRFDEFDELVKKFFSNRLKQTELSILALDLQTTAAFGSIGNHIYFAISAFADYLVALRFKSGDFSVAEESGEVPDRMPTIDQIIMWAGMAETEKKDINYHLELLSKNGIDIPMNYGMLLDAKLALYPSKKEEEIVWSYLNHAIGVPIVTNAVVLRAAAGSDSTVRVKILNKKGLHARASSRLARAYEAWLEELAGRWEKPVLFIGREGPGEEKVTLSSLMGLMMLSAGPGTMMVIYFENCTRADVETLLERLKCERPSRSQKYWGALLGDELDDAH